MKDKKLEALLDAYWQVSTNNCAAGIRSMENGWEINEAAEERARQAILDYIAANYDKANASQ